MPQSAITRDSGYPLSHKLLIGRARHSREGYIGMDLQNTTITAPPDGITGIGTAAPATVAEADARVATLKETLKVAMLNGQVQTIVQVQQELNQLPAIRRAINLRDLKAELETIEEKFAENAREETSLIQLRNEIQARLTPLIEEVQRVGKDFEAANFALSLVYSSREGLHVARRETKSKIAGHVLEINKEVGINEH